MSLVLLQCVHRDLAARNVLLGRDNVAMVSDFGLSRDVYQSGAYEQIDRVGKWMFLVTFKSKSAAPLRSLRFSDFDNSFVSLSLNNPKREENNKQFIFVTSCFFLFLVSRVSKHESNCSLFIFLSFSFLSFYSFRIKAKAFAHSMDGHRVFKWFGIHHRIWRVSLFAHSTWNN